MYAVKGVLTRHTRHGEEYTQTSWWTGDEFGAEFHRQVYQTPDEASRGLEAGQTVFGRISGNHFVLPGRYYLVSVVEVTNG